MDRQQQLYIERLRSHGYSNTKPRQEVFRVLSVAGHDPISMQDLVAHTRCDRASAYRAVKTLESAGIIKRIHIGWKYKLELSDALSDHHHHITCTACGRVHATHDDAALERELLALAQRCGYKMTDHHIDIKGICKECRAN